MTAIVSDRPISEVDLHLVDSVDEAFACMNWLGERRHGGITFDTETGGFNFKRDALRLCQFGDENSGWSIPWDRWGGVAQEIFNKYDGQLILHNRPFDANYALEKGVVKRFPWERAHCTMIMSHVINPARSHALKSLSTRFVDRNAAAGESALKGFMSGSNYNWATVPIDNPLYWGYGAMDTVINTRLFNVLYDQLRAEQAEDIYNMELAVQRVCANMTRRGTKVDLVYCRQKAETLRAWAAEARDWAKAEFGIKNVTSAMQAVKVFEEDGIEFTELTATGQVRLDKNVLLTLEHPLAQAILKIRKTEKLCSTYLDNFNRFADDDGFIHPNIRTCGTRTARMSMSDPNFQNLPKNDHTIRDGVVPDSPDHGLLTCDADQIELRLMAHFAGDEGLRNAFAEAAAAAAAGETDPTLIDFFCKVATQMLGEVIGKEDPRRKTTKNSWYARLYGAGAAKIAATAGVPVWKIEEINDLTDQVYPGIKRFMKQIEREITDRYKAEGEAYIRSYMGRKLPVDRDKAYTGTNYKIQCTAAEVFKLALISLDAAGFSDYMLLPVHDEIVLSVPKTEIHEAQIVVADTMTKASEGMFDLPITWSADILPGAWGGRLLTDDLALAA